MFENKSLPNPQSTIQMEDRKMAATAFLSQAYKYHQCIDSKLEQIAVLRSLTQKITASYDSETVTRTRNVSVMQDSIIRLLEAEEHLQMEIDHLLRVKADIAAVIAQVANTNERIILEKRYLSFKSWDEIAVEMRISPRWAYTLHDRALKAVDQVLSKQNKERAV